MIGIQFPFLDGDLSTPLLKTVYLGHPAATEFTGDKLADDILELLQGFGFTSDDLAQRLVAGGFDGQYLHLKVLKRLGM